MKKEIEFVVFEKPVAKQRPRFSSKTGVVYTPKKTVEAEQKIKFAFIEKYGIPEDFIFPKDTPIKLEVIVYFLKPKSAKKRKFPTVKPDYDNLLKTVSDALQKFIFYDDSQICDVKFSKRYGYPERICIKVSEAGD